MNLKNNFLLKKDIIILCLRTNNLHDMIYGSWDKECDRLKFVIMGHFLPFTLPPKNEKKSEFWKNEKNCWRYGVRHRIFCHFGPFFAFIPPNYWKKQWKKHLEMLSLYTCVSKFTIIWCMLHEIRNTTHNFLSFWAIFFPLSHYWLQK